MKRNNIGQDALCSVARRLVDVQMFASSYVAQIEQDDREYGEISDRELPVINRNAFLSWKRQDVLIHTSLPGTYPEGNICSKWETISPEL